MIPYGGAPTAGGQTLLAFSAATARFQAL